MQTDGQKSNAQTNMQKEKHGEKLAYIQTDSDRPAGVGAKRRGRRTHDVLVGDVEAAVAPGRIRLEVDVEAVPGSAGRPAEALPAPAQHTPLGPASGPPRPSRAHLEDVEEVEGAAKVVEGLRVEEGKVRQVLRWLPVKCSFF